MTWPRLHQAQGLGAEDVVITGGEPLLHPRAVELVEDAKRWGYRVNLVTNGLRIERSVARRLAMACEQVTISVDSADPTLHDLHRGHGRHGRASRAIAVLRKVGFRHVVAAGVLTCHNQHERHEDFETYAGSLGANGVSRAGTFNNGMPVMHGCVPTLPPSWPVWGRNSTSRSNGPDLGRKRLPWSGGTGVVPHARGGHRADEVVYPCQRLMRPEFAAGSLREEPLQRIYTQAPVLTEFRAITVADIPGCSRCAYSFPLRRRVSGASL